MRKTHAVPLAVLVTLGTSIGCSSSSPDATDRDARPSSSAASASTLPTLRARVTTPALHSYDDAPRTVDSDDPAIWVSPRRNGEALVIGVLKDAGLQVYDLRGRVVQTVSPPNRPAVGASDPPSPGAQPEAATGACPDSESGESFGRFNNVDVQYGFELKDARGEKRKVDLAIVTDRGCDRLRIYAIEPGRAGGPLVDVTAADAPRVFPTRFVQPSAVQPTGEARGEKPNPVDDQSTAYGLALYRDESDDDTLRAFVTQRSRAVVAELEVFATRDGRVSYRRARELRFDPAFRIPSATGGASIAWTPCREEAADDPQLEGLVVDQQLGVLYAAQEVVGIWKIPLARRLPRVFDVPHELLIEPVKSFGAPYWAVPDEDEFACEREAPIDAAGALPPGTIVAPGNAAVSGTRIEADVEGLAIYYGEGARGYLVVSSQGDDTFHVFRRAGGSTRATANGYVGGFRIEGVGETDGHDLVNVPAGRGFGSGLFVVQNGKAPKPASEEPIGGYEYDGSTRFELLGWEDVARSFRPALTIDTRSYDPRDPHDD